MNLTLLHAFPLDSRIWKHQIAALGNEFQIVAPDLRGFGNAADALGGLSEISIDLAADDVVRLFDEQGIAKTALAGISRGGYIAMSLAHRYPERFSALILMDTRATPADSQEQQYYEGLIRSVQEHGVSVLPELMSPRLLRTASPPDLRNEISGIMLSQKPEAVIAASRGMVKRRDATGWLQAIRIPALAIGGSEDAAFESTKFIAASIPGAEFVEVRDAGHLSNLEQPGLVNQALRRFLNTV